MQERRSQTAATNRGLLHHSTTPLLGFSRCQRFDACRQPRFLTGSQIAMNNLRFGRLVQRRSQIAQSRCRFRRFLGIDQGEEFPFQRVNLRLDGFVVRLAALAGARLFGGRTCSWHCLISFLFVERRDILPANPQKSTVKNTFLVCSGNYLPGRKRCYSQCITGYRKMV